MSTVQDPFSRASQSLSAIGSALKGSPRLNAAIADILYDEVMDNFDAGGNPRWASLADSTLQQRARQGNPNPKPLEGLERFLRKRSTATEATVYMDIDPAIAGAHQFGTDRAGRGNTTKIPARPYLVIGSRGRVKIVQAWENHLRRSIR